jgi:hypothetical protein
MKALSLTFQILLALTSYSRAECMSKDELFTGFRMNLQKAIDIVPSDQADPVASLVTNTDMLEKVLAANEQIPSSYCISLSKEGDYLGMVAASGDAGATVKAVTFINEDIDTKVKYASTALALAKPSLEVKVTVQTLSGIVEERGLDVSLTPLLFANEPPLFPFNDQSSPTTSYVPPGRYQLRGEKAGIVECVKDNVGVGLNGEHEQALQCVHQ